MLKHLLRQGPAPSPNESWLTGSPRIPGKSALAAVTQSFRKPHTDTYFPLISLRDRQSGSDNQLCLQCQPHRHHWMFCKWDSQKVPDTGCTELVSVGPGGKWREVWGCAWVQAAEP